VFAVGYVRQFVEQPMMEHQQAIKRILFYIVGTLDYGLRYERCPGTTHLIAYYESDLVGDINTSKSISGIMFFLGHCPVSWQSLKQWVVALSSCEAEYIATTSAATQALWLARLLSELLGRKTETVKLKVDSKSALALDKNPVFHERSEHIWIKYHFIRSCLEDGNMKASHISTEDQLADIVTKSLWRVKFYELRARIGLVHNISKSAHNT
jgi:hypothetical protein